ncbi:MAG: class I SAM-dependent methyltransferase [Thermoplasmata archaeon]
MVIVNDSVDSEYSKFVNGITFKHILPSTSLPIGYGFLIKWLGRFNLLPGRLDLAVATLPYEDSVTKKNLRNLCRIPKMSTFAIGAMINKGVSLMNPNECFLNIGVWNGFTFLSGLVNNEDKTCIGVDNFSQFGGPRDAFLKRFNKYKSPSHHFFDMDYEEYFKKEHKGKIGFYIYDGGHAYKDQLQGLEVAEPYFSDNCIILVDDINWKEPYEATLEFAKKSKNKYAIILEKRTKCNCHPTLWNGIMLLQKIP